MRRRRWAVIGQQSRADRTLPTSTTLPPLRQESWRAFGHDRCRRAMLGRSVTERPGWKRLGRFR